ncbi:MAG: alpha/beta fold hydrolase [Flavobacteriia bacterium]|nr:alpha/beta fold hydrolase [Flavobacteriia bacterium]NBX38594.1 alpha/beta fold hydrolase [Flavobacteriia bacterium]
MLHHKVLTHSSSSEWTVFIHGFGGSSNVWFKQVKAFHEHFNVVLIDLRGHGKSQGLTAHRRYSFELIAREVAEVVAFLKIQKAHFIGVSLGSIIIRQIAVNYPNLVKSMIFAGAITQLDIKSRFFLRLGRILQPVLPYMALYKLFANIMMPKKNHSESRSLFIHEAKKLMTKEFKRWFKLTGRLTRYLNYLQHENKDDKALYVMGSEDHLFVGPAREIVKDNPNLQLEIVANCGHVVNVEQPEAFNKIAIEFIHLQNP